MKLYFLRHTTAVDIAASDAARELTKEGRHEARIAGEALAKLGAKPDHILTSPLVRARQTAESVAKAMKHDSSVKVLDELENGSSTMALLRALKSYSGAKELLLVGHMPSLSDHVGILIGARSADGLAFGKGGVACVEVEELRAGKGQLRWLMRNKQLAQILDPTA